jgi:hypothetical protein
MRGRVQTVAMKQALVDVKAGMSTAEAAKKHGLTPSGITKARVKMFTSPNRLPVVCQLCGHAQVVEFETVDDIYGFKVSEPLIPKDSPLFQRLMRGQG